MCDVPSIAVFCSESIECFPGTASKFFLKRLVTIPVAPIITGIVVHFRFHIRCISIHKYYTLLLLLLLLLLLFRNFNIIFTSLGKGLYPLYVNKSLNQAYNKDFVREMGSGYQNATLLLLFPHPPFRQHAPSMRSGKHLYLRNAPVSQLTALRPLSIIPFGIKALYPNRCYPNNDNNADHLLFSTIRKHSFLSFGKVDIYIFISLYCTSLCARKNSLLLISPHYTSIGMKSIQRDTASLFQSLFLHRLQ